MSVKVITTLILVHLVLSPIPGRAHNTGDFIRTVISEPILCEDGLPIKCTHQGCERVLTLCTRRAKVSTSVNEQANQTTRLLLPFEDTQVAVRDIRCFAGFFEEGVCDGVSEICSMTARGFDSVMCVRKVCAVCSRVRLLRGSRALERYCRYLLGGSCGRVGMIGMGRMALESRVRFVSVMERFICTSPGVSGMKRMKACGMRKKSVIGMIVH